MNSDAIFKALEEIGADSSKNAKVAMVAKFGADPDFKRVLVAALHPLVSYGISKHPGTIGTNLNNEFDAGTWEVIDGLKNRTLTGNAAIEAVRGELTALSEDSATLLWRIITKDLRAGFGESTVNKAIKGLIPDAPYMRCSLPKEAKLGEFDWVLGVLSQEKADGMFVNCDHSDAGEVRLTTRPGHEFPLDALQNIVKEVQSNFVRDTQTHGELLVVRDGVVLARQVGNGILNHVSEGGTFGPGEFAIYKVWDQVPLKMVLPKGKCLTKYLKRFALLKSQTDKCQYAKMIDTRIVHSLKEAYVHYRELLALGKEGTVVKDPHGPWTDSTSKFQVKLKLTFECDLEVVEYLPGDAKGKYADTFGSILMKTTDGLLNVGIAQFKADVHAKLWRDRLTMIGKIITVKANDIMPPSSNNPLYSLFLPGYVEVREDKTVADTLQRVIDQYEAAKEAA